jgi:lipopolysaccharide export system permease protein
MTQKKRSYKATRSLGWYLGGRFFGGVFISLMALTSITLILDILESLRRVGKVEHGTTQDALLLTFYKMPDLIFQLLPFAILLGTLWCFSRLSHLQELTAVRSSGLAARHFLTIPLVICFIIGGLAVVVLNPVAATLQKSHDRLSAQLFPGASSSFVTTKGTFWLKQPRPDGGETLIYANKVMPRERSLHDATLLTFTEGGRLESRKNVEKMELLAGSWELRNVKEISFDTIEERELDYLKTTLTPDALLQTLQKPTSFSIFDLPAQIKLLKQTGFSQLQYSLHFHKLLALPLFIIALFFLAAPFSLHFSRQTGTGVLILFGIVTGFSFYLLTNIINALGMAGQLNIYVAAWTPAVLALLIGTTLMLQFREE